MAEPNEPARLTAFSAVGILGFRNYRLVFDSGVSIIVGPNGTGKSTFLNLFYLFISRQWQRLSEYDFDRVILEHSKGTIELTKTELLTFESTTPKRSNTDRIVYAFQQHNSIDLLFKQTLTKDERATISSIAGVSGDQINNFRKYIQTEFSFAKKGLEIDRDIQRLNLGQILFLPTYRRIEKDIKSIFPDIESRLRARIEDGSVSPRTGATFREIASFGMGDVQKLIDDYTADAREFRRLASEAASQEYIRDIVRGKIKKYSLSNLRRMPDEDFEEFKDSLDEKLFTDADRQSLRVKIDALRHRHHGQPAAEARYLGMFVEKLLAAHQRVKDRERPLRTFIATLTNYLKPDKQAILAGHNIAITSNDGRDVIISLDKLSSGEKQIVSIFAYLLLSGQKDFILLIDEPELSLSVPWQKQFIPDLVSTGSCSQIMTVTHSPFVFDNTFRKNVVDVRRLRMD
jgi:predicted ATP-dependent endonuclease of OLD family